MKDESIFIKCQCGGCSVLEINTNREDNNFNISLWVNHPGTRPMDKKERSRWYDNVNKTGMPWADHTIISKKDALKIVKFLNKHIKLYERSK